MPASLAVAHRKVVGSACLYRESLVPERRFLKRNLRHVLDAHERIVKGVGAAPSIFRHHVNGAMTVNGRGGDGFEYPEREVLEDLMKGRKPVLRIDGLQFRRKGSQGQVSGRRDDDWLPSPNVASSFRCVVNVQILEAGSGRQVHHADCRPATIWEHLHDGRTLYFDVELDRRKGPFLIDVERLFTVKEFDTNGQHRWKRAVADKYVLEITIRCDNDRDSRDLFTRMEGQPAHYLKGNECLLKASWDELPTLPWPGQLMPLKRTKGHKGRLDLGDYRLAVSMGWARHKVTPLEQWNVARTKSSMARQQLPTPSASEESEKLVQQPTVVYRYLEGVTMRTRAVAGLTCPLCVHSEEQPSFARLRLHCATHHDHFSFDAHEEQLSQGSSSTAPRYTIDISLNTAPADTKPTIKTEPEEINWIAPHRPFDVSAHLNGISEWIPDNARPRIKGKGRGRQVGPKATNSYSAYGIPRIVQKRPALDEIGDLPEPRPKRRRLPDVPGVNFYHRISKQRIEPGTEIYDSEEDIDEDWLAERKEREMEDAGVPQVEREYRMAFGRHMARERTETVVLLREALVRFVKRFREEFRGSLRWRILLRRDLQSWRAQGMVAEETVDFCSVLARGVERMLDEEGEDGPDAQLQGEMAESSRKMIVGTIGGSNLEGGGGMLRGAMGKRRVDRREDERREEVSRAVVHGLCVCGIPATNAQGAIACASGLDCKRLDFHLACVGLEKRVLGWRCSDCAA